MSIRIKAPGKLILLGEYAVLEGANALVAAVDRYVLVEIVSSNSGTFEISGNLTSEAIHFSINSDGTIIPENGQPDQTFSNMTFALTIITQINKKILDLGLSIKPYNIQINTSQFYIESNKLKLGLGSSASMTVALISSILNFLGIEKDIFPDKYDQFSFACESHFIAQGKRGSGVDIASSYFGGINVYNIKSPADKNGNQRISTVPVLKELSFLPVWTGISASTRELLLQVEDFRSKYKAEYRQTMSRLSTLSDSGCLAYKEKNISDFLDIIQDYYQVLKSFSKRSKIAIISDIHEKIARIVYSMGGYYKPSGAGGGDIGIAFSDSKRTLEKIKAELENNKIESLPLKIAQKGVTIYS